MRRGVVIGSGNALFDTWLARLSRSTDHDAAALAIAALVGGVAGALVGAAAALVSGSARDARETVSVPTRRRGDVIHEDEVLDAPGCVNVDRRRSPRVAALRPA
jgi:hypothetical protein